MITTYLSIHQHHIAIPELPSDRNEADLGKQSTGNGFAIIVTHLTQVHPSAVGKLDPHRARIIVRPTRYQLSHLLDISFRYRSRVSQSFGKIKWQANFICTNVGIRRDDGSTSEVYTLSHHMPEKQGGGNKENVEDEREEALQNTDTEAKRQWANRNGHITKNSLAKDAFLLL